MNCLLTGANGFLGKHIYQALIGNQDEVTCVVRKTIVFPDARLVNCDLATSVPVLDGTFEKVIHVAGKAHVVPSNETEREAFFKVNVDGTRNLLAALAKLPVLPRVFVNISTVAVYGVAAGENISEEQIPAPVSPYGKSKLASEELISAWCAERNVKCYHLRLPLIFGNAPLGNLDRMIRGINKGFYLQIKDNKARKSIVLADDVAWLILSLGEAPDGVFNLTDGSHPAVSEIETALENVLGKKIRFSVSRKLLNICILPGNILKLAGKPNPLAGIVEKLTASLTFSDDKARRYLQWKPRNVLNHLSVLDFNNGN